MNTQTTTDSISSIQKSSVLFFLGTIISRSSGLLRDIILAYTFGNSLDLSSLFVAIRFTYLFRRIFGEGALQSSFIPLFETVKKENRSEAFLFFRDLTALWILLLTLISCIGIFVLRRIEHIVPNEYSSIISLTRIMLPSLIPICLFGLNISLMQSEKQYFLPGIAPIFFNFTLIVAAISSRYFSFETEATFLAYAVVFGCFLQYGATLIPVFKHTKKELQEKFFASIRIGSKYIKKFTLPLTLSVVGIGASQLNNALDALFAHNAGPDGPAQLWFSIRFYQLPLALFGVALSNAILPPLCRAFRSNDITKFQNFIDHAIRQTIALLLPCTCFLCISGGYVINCFYGHGSFSASDVLNTAVCLQGYSIGLIPSGLILIFAPAFYAQQTYKIPVQAAIISLILNGLQNALYVYGFHLGALSITIATSISGWVNCIYLYNKLRIDSNISITTESVHEIKKSILVGLMAASTTYGLCACFYETPPLFLCTTAPEFSRNFFIQLQQVVFATATFSLSTFLYAKLLQSKDTLNLFLPFFKHIQKIVRIVRN